MAEIIKIEDDRFIQYLKDKNIMPCTYDESIDDQNELRKEMDRVYRLLHYTYKAINFTGFRKPILYGESYLANNTRTLCGLLKNASEKNLTKLFGDARIKEARELAEWWEKHQELDKERELEEKRQAVLSKLTAEEIEILGLR